MPQLYGDPTTQEHTFFFKYVIRTMAGIWELLSECDIVMGLCTVGQHLVEMENNLQSESFCPLFVCIILPHRHFTEVYWIQPKKRWLSPFHDPKAKVLDPLRLRSSSSKKLNFHLKRQTDPPPSPVASRSHSFSPHLPSCVHRLVPLAQTKDDYTNPSPRKSRHFISSQTKSQWRVMSL